MERLKKFWTVPTEKSSTGSGSSSISSSNASPAITIDELQYLQGHQDIVRHLLRVDEKRLASGGDDGNVFVWDSSTGAKLHALSGHTLQITCLLLLEKNTLLSGSSDKTIRVWNLKTGECSQILNRHSGSVKCMTKMDPPNRSRAPISHHQHQQQQQPSQPWFCSGANDRNLHVWRLVRKSEVELLGTIERSEEENLNCMISLNSKFVVTSSSSSSIIYVYSVDSMKFHRILSYHRESPQCLVQVSEFQFVSGSLDGMVVVWHADTLVPLRVLNSPEQFLSVEHTFPFRVRHLLPLGDQYIAAAIGNGFEIYDVLTGDLVLQCEKAHDGPVTCIISLYGGTRILTSSADSSVKVWAVPKQLRFLSFPDPKFGSRTLGSNIQHGNHAYSSSSSSSSASMRRGNQTGYKPELLGELWGHSNSIMEIVQLNETSFASCAADNFVIAWKDGQQQAELRNNYATYSLLQHRNSCNRSKKQMTTLANQNQNMRSSIEFSDSDQSPPIPNQQKPIAVPTTATTTTNQSNSLLRTSSNGSFVATPILEYVDILVHERKFTPQQVADDLRSSGHNPAVIESVLQRIRYQQNQSQQQNSNSNNPNNTNPESQTPQTTESAPRRWLPKWFF